MSSTARRRVIAGYMDSITQRDISPKGQTQQQEGYTRVNQCVWSSSKLPRLSGSTKRHFPMKSVTRGTQVGVESHTYRYTSHVRTTCPICIDTTMASQHNHTTTQHLFRRLRRALHNMMLQAESHMTHHSEHTINMRKIHVWVQTSIKSG